MSPLARGLVSMELHRGDGSLGTFLIEVIRTYEGTETMQTLIVGRDITGIGAFA
jgi:hypothetical protein